MADVNAHSGFIAPNDDASNAAWPSRGSAGRSNGKGKGKASSEDDGEEDEDGEISDSELMDQLEAELDQEDSGFNMDAFREKRMAQLREELDARQPSMQRESSLRGRYTEFKNERDIIQLTAKEKFAVVHFAHRDFRRCKIMDRHLETIAPQQTSTVFLKIFVENAPFLVEKLQVKVLPCVICFVDGVTKDRLIGFEELGNKDSFGTKALEFRLQQGGVLEKRETSILGYPSVTQAKTADDVDDW
ncbi:thioredoxin-like protein [Tilletiaria anomala UBC 951]|uniref:Thioredoxin-like protein n=1 Tax=Tilletiaria anomala (strain ATCC 24038 / CBS 436.72 / UBC 951) TaxID=1037660 RepID=A0A066W314_TILAU|nr:thioredoxin-like protein [Tilletiaria anomala UBC 951]KDN45474.1 thioredoxin-like protein [Tilletiaria anomala UBC 951]